MSKKSSIDTGAMDAGGEETTATRRAANPNICFADTVSMPMPRAVPKQAPSQTTQAAPTTQQPFVWNLRQVPDLPECHVLERTAVFCPHTTAAVVAKRISNVLREQSIEAEYDDDKAKVKCLSEEGVDFRVRLYRGRDKFSHGIIVEVQRRFGVSLNFCNITRDILDSALGKSVPPPPALGTAEIPLVSDAEDDYQADGASSLRMVSKMLQHPDGTHLALQTLSSLTDSSKVGMSTARSVSEALLSDSESNDVGAKMSALILDTKAKDDDLFQLRTGAVTVLANAMRSVEGRISTMLAEQLEPVLLRDLRAADKNPRAAVQAARCVEMLLRNSTNEQSHCDLHAALATALEAGKARHAGLERQAQLCLDRIP